MVGLGEKEGNIIGRLVRDNRTEMGGVGEPRVGGFQRHGLGYES